MSMTGDMGHDGGVESHHRIQTQTLCEAQVYGQWSTNEVATQRTDLPATSMLRAEDPPKTFPL